MSSRNHVRSPGLVVALVLVLPALNGCLAGSGAGPSEEDQSPRQIYGIAQVGGLASAALPIVPLSSGADGELMGDTTFTGGEAATTHNVLSWFDYCGASKRVPLHDSSDVDRALRYFVPPDLPDATTGGDEDAPWYAERAGEVIHTDDLAVGDAVRATWWNTEGAGIHVLVVRLDEADLPPLTREFAQDGIVAVSEVSTYGCSHVVFGADAPTATVRPYTGADAATSGDLVVDTTHSGAWRASAVIRDVLDPASLPLGTQERRQS